MEQSVSSPLKLLTSLLLMGALLVGCGSESDQDPAPVQKPAAQSKPAKQEPLKSSEIVKVSCGAVEAGKAGALEVE